MSGSPYGVHCSTRVHYWTSMDKPINGEESNLLCSPTTSCCSRLEALPPSCHRAGEMEAAPLLPILLLILSPAATALVFHLPSGRVKCVTEELRAGAMSVGRYRISEEPPPDDHKISAQVSDHRGESVHSAESVESGQFAFVAAEAGRYTACFWSPRFQLSAAVSIDFDWKSGIAAKGWTAVAKKGKINVMEIELKKLEDTVSSIHEEMIFLRESEEAAWRLHETMNSRMALLSLLSLIICLGVTGLQLWHLKAFFEREKIL